MTRVEIITKVWLPAYLAALGRGHDTIRARDIARTAVQDYYEELRRAAMVEAQLQQLQQPQPAPPTFTKGFPS